MKRTPKFYWRLSFPIWCQWTRCVFYGGVSLWFKELQLAAKALSDKYTASWSLALEQKAPANVDSVVRIDLYSKTLVLLIELHLKLIEFIHRVHIKLIRQMTFKFLNKNNVRWLTWDLNKTKTLPVSVLPGRLSTGGIDQQLHEEWERNSGLSSLEEIRQ